MNKLLLKVLLFESILVFTLCAFGVYIVRRLLLKPINILTEEVERISKGNFEHKIDIHTGDEMESLAKGFNKMGEALKGFYYDLEEKIRERTAALKTSETKYRALMEQAYDAIFLVNPDNGQIMEVNLQAEMLTGFSKEELLRIKYWDLYPQHMVNQAVEQFNKGIKRGFMTLHDVPIKKGDGETAWVDISARIVGYNNVRVYHTVMKDITEGKKEEEKLSMTSEQLARSTMVMLEQDTRLEAIKQEMNSLIKHLNMSEILVVLSRAIVDLLGITRIALFEQTGEIIQCTWIHGVENKRLLQLTISIEEEDPIISAIRDLRVVKKGDMAKKSPIDRYFRDWIVFPLRGKDRVVGAFVADTSGTDPGEKLLQSFVDVVAMVLEKDSVIKRAKST
ncbi:MAG: PAS domain S-box protein [Nitrospirae bacterium]|nr:PAS domain S-box protein [Nitrospirota bacterium]